MTRPTHTSGKVSDEQPLAPAHARAAANPNEKQERLQLGFMTPVTQPKPSCYDVEIASGRSARGRTRNSTGVLAGSTIGAVLPKKRPFKTRQKY